MTILPVAPVHVGRRKALISRSHIAVSTIVLIALQIAAGLPSVHASAVARHPGASGHVTVHFALAHGTIADATWSSAFRVIKASAQQFSGCAIETDHVLHSRQLVVHIWPRKTSEFLTRDFKLTVSLTSSNAPSNFPVRPTVAIGFRGTLYSVVNSSASSSATVRHGGLDGTFDIRNVFNASTSQGGLRVAGHWSCTKMLQFTG